MRKFILWIMLAISACSCSHVKAAEQAQAHAVAQFDPALLQQLFQAPLITPYPFDHDEKPVTWKKFVPGILLEGRIDEQMVKRFQATIEKAVEMKVDGMVIVLNTPGGDVESGRAMARAMERAPFNVHCVVDGEADSMGFYFLQACDTRHMTKRSRIMVHNPYYPAGAGSLHLDDILSLEGDLTSLAHSMAEHEVLKMSISVEELQKKIEHQDWWMTDEEALKFKAVDSTVKTIHEYMKTLR